jgi:peptidoglycan LD-endopeptidase CwlK
MSRVDKDLRRLHYERMASRLLTDLLPEIQLEFVTWVKNCATQGVTVLCYCTYRSPEEQDALYEQGRSPAHPGRIVTNSRAWESWHQYRRAVDAVPMIGGCKPVWDYSPGDPHWRVMVQQAKGLGIEWAGDWTGFKEFCHWQITNGLTFEQAKVRVEVDGQGGI